MSLSALVARALSEHVQPFYPLRSENATIAPAIINQRAQYTRNERHHTKGIIYLTTVLASGRCKRHEEREKQRGLVGSIEHRGLVSRIAHRGLVSIIEHRGLVCSIEALTAPSH